MPIFRNGQATGELPDIYGTFKDAYGKGRDELAARLYGQGETDEAARISYGAGRVEQGDLYTGRSAAQAYSNGDYTGAAQKFGRLGQVQNVQASRTAGANADFAKKVQAATRYRTQIQRIAQLPDPNAQQAEYGNFLAQARAEADPDGRPFVESLPQTWTPETYQSLSGTLDKTLATLAIAAKQDTPDAWLANWAAQQKAVMDEADRKLAEGRLEQQTNYQNGMLAVAQGRLDVLEANPPNQGDRGAAGGGMSTPQFNRANAYRDEFNTQTKEFSKIDALRTRSESYYGQVQQNGGRGNGQGDIALVYALATALDPGSVVREQDFATIAASGQLDQRLQGYYEKAASGGFNQSVRSGIVTQIRAAHEAQAQQYRVARERYEQLSQDSGIDSKFVVGTADMPSSGAQNIPSDRRQLVPGQAYAMANGTVGIWDPRLRNGAGGFREGQAPQPGDTPATLRPPPAPPPSTAVTRSFSTMPPAAQFAGKTVRDEAANKRYRSDGTRWIEVQ